MSKSYRLADQLADLLVRHGVGGGFVVVNVTPEGPLFAKLEVIDAAQQRAFCVTVEEIIDPPRGAA